MDLTVDELNNVKKDFHDSSVHMKKEIVVDEKVVVFIGGTKAGKSTLINYLIGNELKAESLGKLQPIKILKVDIESAGPAIGLESSSKTTIPTRWLSKKLEGLALFDAPGFGDNRTPVQDIKNAFALYQLFQNIKSLKIALVVDIQYIFNDDVKPFLSVLVAVENLLGHRMKDCFSCISIVFTKVPEFNHDGIPVDIELIKHSLKFNFLSSSELHMSSISKAFIEFITRSDNRIALFKKGKRGPVTSDIERGVFQIIKDAIFIKESTLKKIHPSISDQSKILLFHSREKLCSITNFHKLEETLIKISDVKMDDLNIDGDYKKTGEKLNKHHSKLVEIQGQLFHAVAQTDFYQQLEALQLIDSAIKDIIENNALLENVKLKDFIDKLLDLQESKELFLQFKTIITFWHSKVKECIDVNRLKLGEITRNELDEILEAERAKNKKEIEKLKTELEKLKKINEESKKSFLTKINEFFGNIFKSSKSNTATTDQLSLAKN